MTSKTYSNSRMTFVFILLLYMTVCCRMTYAEPSTILKETRTTGNGSDITGTIVGNVTKQYFNNNEQPSAAHIAIMDASLNRMKSYDEFSDKLKLEINILNYGKAPAVECNIYIEGKSADLSYKACVDYTEDTDCLFKILLYNNSMLSCFDKTPPKPVSRRPFSLEADYKTRKVHELSCPKLWPDMSGIEATYLIQVRCNNNVSSDITYRAPEYL